MDHRNQCLCNTGRWTIIMIAFLTLACYFFSSLLGMLFCVMSIFAGEMALGYWVERKLHPQWPEADKLKLRLQWTRFEVGSFDFRRAGTVTTDLDKVLWGRITDDEAVQVLLTEANRLLGRAAK